MDIAFKTYWSDNIPEEAINDIIFIENLVLYHGGFTRDFFNKKYVHNIYGPSLHILASADGRTVGVHNVWRNDIGGICAYQGTDSCVLPVEGVLIFPKMLSMVKTHVGPDSPIYGVPNKNSLSVNLMMKHQLVATYRQSWCLSPAQYSKEEPIMIPMDYARWWIAFSASPVLSLRWRGHYYLVRTVKQKLGITVLDIVGEVDGDTAQMFPKFKRRVFLLSYKSKYAHWYNKNRSSGFHVTNYGYPISHIPTWTIDAI